MGIIEFQHNAHVIAWLNYTYSRKPYRWPPFDE